ncbi:MAG: hypothetical protein C9356_11995 [Oleiphilus sp.]|nr:MAG: hypothetical protein C9356_11995 [Oleiphilus sp.]
MKLQAVWSRYWKCIAGFWLVLETFVHLLNIEIHVAGETMTYVATFNYQELSTILAGLRVLQDMMDESDLSGFRKLPHFDDVEPLNSVEIDALCERLNCSPEYLEGRYISEWLEGTVQTDCRINLANYELSIRSADCDYNGLQREYIEVAVNGSTTRIDAKAGELTITGKNALAALLGRGG